MWLRKKVLSLIDIEVKTERISKANNLDELFKRADKYLYDSKHLLSIKAWTNYESVIIKALMRNQG